MPFPKDFIWATATSAFQVEGAQDVRGRTQWDEICSQAGRIPSAIAFPDSVRLLNEDIKCIQQLGVTHYRFSIGWTRLLNEDGSKNVDGAGYYVSLCEALRQIGVKPIVTLSHADVPQAFVEDEGGWASEKSIDKFVHFAKTCFEVLAGLADTWITFNEIIFNSWCGIVEIPGQPRHAIRPLSDRTVPYKAIKNQLLAHAKVYRYFKEHYKGECGITLGCTYPAPESDNDASAKSRALAWHFGAVADPIFLDGNWPAEIAPFLPELTAQEKELIRGSSDFLGLNYYVAKSVHELGTDEEPESLLEKDARVGYTDREDWEKISGDTWLVSVPWALEEVLRMIRDRYDNVSVMITENGCADFVPAPEGAVDPLVDENRVRYLTDHIKAVENAIRDGCHVIGYTAWSLMDNFEWQDGLTRRFGLFHVNFEDPNRKRSPKKSAVVYQDIVAKAKHQD